MKRTFLSTSFFVFAVIVRFFGENIHKQSERGAVKISVKGFEAGLCGAAAGFLNGLFGSGGGMVAVPMLKKSGLSVKEAHATSVFMMAALSVLSAGFYLYSGRLVLSEGAGFIPAGALGALAGALFFKKINSRVLKKIFGGFIVFSALKILWGQFFA